ncbi:DNA starvation/stationary phase protection protein [Edwardsiella piscicida]|uniref:Dps family protein n=1 Tax=Edwardsiella piscicida TaxID=1263550 RepID=UPI0002C142E3|nr:Dps family protein [Edwardsiella piscicida]AGH73546.1 Non-specific DNA-binding protein Dps / Iron-binding ferritin-like antioxidant protein / ferroxidase [Edwardsiella piscicida C07-087]EKS7779230.1 DNA starvation/stationary phase protection protein [Edwardsiella piscicida]EKS7782650.1 DNA starvation/stationary phase protection protein [Edwardsiella piscicida]EKS7794871.1 DNA starvation/stationary phase protection protein [Edwardsiella piscicida]EKS7811765.1 DNA starvation/stationary phase 
MANSKKNAKTHIGLDPKKSAALADALNVLLANYQILYMNVRGYHWNISGPQFFELHVKFEETYNDLLLKVDELAERILTLGYRPRHAFSDYLKSADIKEDVDVTDDRGTLQGLLSGYALLLQQQREILQLATDASDEGTVSLMSDYIKQQEKQVWMLNAYLGQ